MIVGTVFFGKRAGEVSGWSLDRPDTLRGPAEALTGHGSIGVKGFPAPGTFVLAGFLMLIFVVYYFINYGYLASVWKFS